MICPEDVSRGKPNPDPLLKVNKVFDLRPNQISSLYVGDMFSDYQASISANWHFVHAAWGYGEILERIHNSNKNEYVRIERIFHLKDYLLEWVRK